MLTCASMYTECSMQTRGQLSLPFNRLLQKDNVVDKTFIRLRRSRLVNWYKRALEIHQLWTEWIVEQFSFLDCSDNIYEGKSRYKYILLLILFIWPNNTTQWEVLINI